MKGRLAAWGCLAALGLLLARSAEAAQAVRDGLALCAGSVIPALFPFLAVSGLLTALDAGTSPALGPLARLLGCSRAGARAFLLGLTGSYPVGARTVAQLYRRGGISRREACRLLLFSNNVGLNELDDQLNGTTSLAVCMDDPVAPARVIADYAKKLNGKFEIKGGFMEGKVVSLETVNALASIPALPVLQAQVLGTMLAPISALACVLKQIAEKDGAPAEEAAAE